MPWKHSDQPIGYRVLDIGEECFEYYDNACFIADSHANAKQHLKTSWGNAPGYRIEQVDFATMMEECENVYDEYEMELEAYARFQQVAKDNAIPLSFKLHGYDGTVMKVKIGEEDWDWDDEDEEGYWDRR